MTRVFKHTNLLLARLMKTLLISEAEKHGESDNGCSTWHKAFESSAIHRKCDCSCLKLLFYLKRTTCFSPIIGNPKSIRRIIDRISSVIFILSTVEPEECDTVPRAPFDNTGVRSRCFGYPIEAVHFDLSQRAVCHFESFKVSWVCRILCCYCQSWRSNCSSTEKIVCRLFSE